MAERQQIGGMTPSTAKIVVDVVRYLRANGFVVNRGTQSAFSQPSEPIHVKNISGEEIPAFACLQAVGTLEKGGQNYIEVDKPADAIGTAGWYLFNGIAAIETDGFGIAYDGPCVRMLTDGSAVSAGDRWQPVVNDWTVEPGGELFIAIGDDDIATDVMRAFIVGLPAENCKPPITDLQLSGGWLQVSRDCGSTWENEIQLTTSCPEPAP